MKTPALLPVLLIFFSMSLVATPRGVSADLTPGQIESLKVRIKMLKENLNGHLSTRNLSAGDLFQNASTSSRAAIELYLKCHKLVNFDRKDLKESDFRSWKESQEGKLGSDEFAESLQIQLRYLSISCRVAEVKELDEVFGPLTAYVNSLSQLEELPDGILMNSIGGSVFAQAYNIEDLLGQNKSWEPVPFNIAGIYTKTILPYLRLENPEALMTAWDSRIEQETRLVAFYEKQKDKELRGKNAKEKRSKRGELNRSGGKTMEGHNKAKFVRETLPNLNWGKLMDMYSFIDQVAGAKAMLDFVEKNLTSPDGERFFQQFLSLIESASPPETPAKAPPVSTPSN